MENGTAEEQDRSWYVHGSQSGSSFYTKGFDSLTLASEFVSDAILDAVQDFNHRNRLIDNLRAVAREDDSTFLRAILRYAIADAMQLIADAAFVDTETGRRAALHQALTARVELAVVSGVSRVNPPAVFFDVTVNGANVRIAR